MASRSCSAGGGKSARGRGGRCQAGARSPSTASMVSTVSMEGLMDMISLLLRCSDGGGSPGSFLAVHPSVSVSYKVVLDLRPV